jgi:hypothetical protein
MNLDCDCSQRLKLEVMSGLLDVQVVAQNYGLRKPLSRSFWLAQAAIAFILACASRYRAHFGLRKPLSRSFWLAQAAIALILACASRVRANVGLHT